MSSTVAGLVQLGGLVVLRAVYVPFRPAPRPRLLQRRLADRHGGYGDSRPSSSWSTRMCDVAIRIDEVSSNDRCQRSDNFISADDQIRPVLWPGLPREEKVR
jgi:hypothetical protein